jgi:hypothetical protein
MPLGAIKCTECGSGDVKEVKANTYFCDHCETFFRYIDPSRVTVQRDFCECGGVIAFQCRVCRVGLCVGHDAARPYWIAVEPDVPDQAGPWLPTTVPAYRLPDELTKGWPEPWRSEFYVDTSKKQNWLSICSEFHGGEVHLCERCLEERLFRTTKGECERVARAKVAGEMCALPGCFRDSEVQCSCCHLRFCLHDPASGVGHFLHDDGWDMGEEDVCPACWGERQNFSDVVEELEELRSARRDIEQALMQLPQKRSTRSHRVSLERQLHEAAAAAKQRWLHGPCKLCSDKGFAFVTDDLVTPGVFAAWAGSGSGLGRAAG